MLFHIKNRPGEGRISYDISIILVNGILYHGIVKIPGRITMRPVQQKRNKTFISRFIVLLDFTSLSEPEPPRFRRLRLRLRLRGNCSSGSGSGSGSGQNRPAPAAPAPAPAPAPHPCP